MEDYRKERIEIQFPCNIKQILKLKLIEEEGKHTNLFLKVLLKEETEEEAMKKLFGEITVSAFVIIEEKRDCIFQGLLTAVEVSKKEEGIEAELEAISYSYQLDQKKKIQSFLQEERGVIETIKEVLEKYEKADSHICIKERELLHPLLEYEETDWKFLKRLLSLHKCPLFVNSEAAYPRIIVGIPEWSIPVKEKKSFVIEEKRRFLKGKTELCIRSQEEYDCGTVLELPDKRKYVIMKKETELRKEEIWRRYQLNRVEEVEVEYEANFELQGKSVLIEVKEREGEKISFCLENELEKEGRKKRWFVPYAIKSKNVYWMPEEGEQAELYFPSCLEWEGEAVEARRKESEKSIRVLREEPEKKSFSTVYGEKLEIGKTGIKMEADMDKAMKIELLENGNINIRGENIEIEAQGKIELGKVGRSKRGKEIVTSKLEGRAGERIIIGKVRENPKTKQYDVNKKQYIEVKEGIQVSAENRVETICTSNYKDMVLTGGIEKKSQKENIVSEEEMTKEEVWQIIGEMVVKGTIAGINITKNKNKESLKVEDDVSNNISTGNNHNTGKKNQEETKKSDMEILEGYLNAEIEEETAILAAQRIAETGILYEGKQKRSLNTYTSRLYSKRDYQRYDAYILAWTGYYNKKETSYKINPEIIKGIAYRETSIGYFEAPQESPNANIKRDIMQVLDPRNPTIYDYADVNPQEKYIDGYISLDYKRGNLSHIGYKFQRSGANVFVPAATRLFLEKEDRYEYQYEEATPFLSIALGIFTYQRKLKIADGNEREAIENYNGSDNKVNYAKDVLSLAKGETISNVDEVPKNWEKEKER